MRDLRLDIATKHFRKYFRKKLRLSVRLIGEMRLRGLLEKFPKVRHVDIWRLRTVSVRSHFTPRKLIGNTVVSFELQFGSSGEQCEVNRKCWKHFGTRIASIAKCSQLEHLNFWSAPRVTDVGIGHLKNLPKLTFLNIGFTQASLEAIDDGVLQNLELLYLNNTKLGSSRLSKLSNCKKLKTLAIYLMKINDEGLEVLKQLPSLVALEVGTATITDRGLDTIDQLSTLKHLDLRGTPVSDTKVEEFRRKHPECKILR